MNIEAIEKELNRIGIDINLEEIEISSKDELRDYLDNNDYFNIEIIYYVNAIEYLKNNDGSLKESLGLASEYGYSLENLSSEILASIHASDKVREDFEDLDLEEYFE